MPGQFPTPRSISPFPQKFRAPFQIELQNFTNSLPSSYPPLHSSPSHREEISVDPPPHLPFRFHGRAPQRHHRWRPRHGGYQEPRRGLSDLRLLSIQAQQISRRSSCPWPNLRLREWQVLPSGSQEDPCEPRLSIQTFLIRVTESSGFPFFYTFPLRDSQCRQRTTDFGAPCRQIRKDKPCPIKFCYKCLLNRFV